MIDFSQLQKQVLKRIERYERKKQRIHLLSWTAYSCLLLLTLTCTHFSLQPQINQPPAFSSDILTEQLDPFMDVDEIIQESDLSLETFLPPDSVYFHQVLASTTSLDLEENF